MVERLLRPVSVLSGFGLLLVGMWWPGHSLVAAALLAIGGAIVTAWCIIDAVHAWRRERERNGPW